MTRLIVSFHNFVNAPKVGVFEPLHAAVKPRRFFGMRTVMKETESVCHTYIDVLEPHNTAVFPVHFSCFPSLL